MWHHALLNVVYVHGRSVSFGATSVIPQQSRTASHSKRTNEQEMIPAEHSSASMPSQHAAESNTPAIPEAGTVTRSSVAAEERAVTSIATRSVLQPDQVTPATRQRPPPSRSTRASSMPAHSLTAAASRMEARSSSRRPRLQSLQHTRGCDAAATLGRPAVLAAEPGPDNDRGSPTSFSDLWLHADRVCRPSSLPRSSVLQ